MENKIRENEKIIREQKGKNAVERNERIEIGNIINKRKDEIYDLKGNIIKIKDIMDALAYTIFSKFDLKWLGEGQSSGYISGKKGIEKELEVLHEIINDDKIAILNDLTNCIKVGDISEKQDDRINLIEVKTSGGKNHRIIRQEEKRQSFMEYLHNDTIENFNGKNFRRLYTYKEENYLVQLNEMLDISINENVIIQEMEEGLYYSVMYKPENHNMIEMKDIIDNIKHPICYNLNIFKNEEDLTNNPFLNYFDNVIDYMNFIIGDLLIVVFLDFDILRNKLEEKDIIIKRINDDKWACELEFIIKRKKDKMFLSKHYFNRIGRKI